METLNSKHAEMRSKIIRLKNYQCKLCRVKQYSIGYFGAFGNFIECDSFMVTYAKKNNINLIRIILKVYHKNQDKIDFDLNNILVLCPSCYAKKANEYKRLRLATKGIIYPRC
jgi:hypothetical protein